MKKFILLVTILSIPLVLVGCQDNSALQKIENSGKIEVVDMKQELSHDWGDINIKGGIVDHTFTLKNSGTNDLIIKGANTSCMCTTVLIEFFDGTKSSKFGMATPSGKWAKVVKPNELFKVKISFDPMAHGPEGTGAIGRQVNLFTSSLVDGKLTVPMSYEMVKKGLLGSVTKMRIMTNVLSEAEYKAKYVKEIEKMENDKNQAADELASDHHDEDEYANMPDYEIRGKHVLEKIQNKDDFVLIDIRENFELEETGVIEGTIHIPLGNISLNAMGAAGISKSDFIVLYCRSGNRSRQGYELLNALGFTTVKSMRGGMVHWLEDKRPVVKWIPSEVKKLEPMEIKDSGAKISFDRYSEDFGLIAPTEKKETVFTITNSGTDDLIIGNIVTSCTCTSAEIESKTIAPGDSTRLTVFFDPNVHEEPKDRFKRTIFLETNDPNMLEAEVTIWVDIDEEE